MFVPGGVVAMLFLLLLSGNRKTALNFTLIFAHQTCSVLYLCYSMARHDCPQWNTGSM